MTVGDRLRNANRKVAAVLERRYPYRGVRAFDEFPRTIQQLAAEHGGGVLVDVGAGADSSFLNFVRRGQDSLRIVGVDISAEALETNDALDEKYVVDVVQDGLPLQSGSVNMVISRAVLEHLSNVEILVRESARVLVPGGYSVHISSCRNAPFAIVGRLLPHRVSQRLLFGLYPEVVGVGGFETHYDRSTPDQIANLFEHHDFEVVDRRVSYRSSHYFSSLGLLFLLARLYENMLERLGLQELASYVTIVGRKTDREPLHSG